MLGISVAAFNTLEIVAALAAVARAPWALLLPLVVLPAATATVAVFGIWWFVIMIRRRDVGLPASERAALAGGESDLRALRRIAAPVQLLPAALAASVVGLVAVIAAVVASGSGSSSPPRSGRRRVARLEARRARTSIGAEGTQSGFTPPRRPPRPPRS